MHSSKRNNFVRLAEARVTKAQNAIRLIGNLANRSNYEYSEEDVRQILAALQAELQQVRDRFRDLSSESRSGFKLKG